MQVLKKFEITHGIDNIKDVQNLLFSCSLPMSQGQNYKTINTFLHIVREYLIIFIDQAFSTSYDLAPPPPPPPYPISKLSIFLSLCLSMDILMGEGGRGGLGA
jgi:hypothetical protein